MGDELWDLDQLTSRSICSSDASSAADTPEIFNEKTGGNNEFVVYRKVYDEKSSVDKAISAVLGNTKKMVKSGRNHPLSRWKTITSNITSRCTSNEAKDDAWRNGEEFMV